VEGTLLHVASWKTGTEIILRRLSCRGKSFQEDWSGIIQTDRTEGGTMHLREVPEGTQWRRGSPGRINMKYTSEGLPGVIENIQPDG
jgi:hypothetical protein